VGASTDISGPDGRFINENGFVVRWDGTAWHMLCNSGCGPDWSDIDATGKSVWVVGRAFFPDDPYHPVAMQIDRWSGNGWVPQAVQSAPVTPKQTPMYSLDAVSVSDGLVVSVGSSNVVNGAPPTPLVDQRPDR
jgi:hypothetical protein